MPEWADEDTWEKAKQAFKKSYDREPESDSDYAIVTSIYKKMGGKIQGGESLKETTYMEKTMMHHCDAKSCEHYQDIEGTTNCTLYQVSVSSTGQCNQYEPKGKMENHGIKESIKQIHKSIKSGDV